MLELWQRFYVESEPPPLTAAGARRELARA
jgi:hypothetical protein